MENYISKKDFETFKEELSKKLDTLSKPQEPSKKEVDEVNENDNSDNKVENKEQNSNELNWKRFRSLEKEVRQLREINHKNEVREIYLKNGGKKDYFDHFYSQNNFKESSNVEKDLVKSIEANKLFFDKKPQPPIGNSFLKENGYLPENSNETKLSTIKSLSEVANGKK